MTRLLLLWALAVSPRLALADDGVLERANAVSRLRTEVDALSHELESERRRARDALTALRLERAELERQIRLERIRARTLGQLAQDRLRRAEQLEAQSDARAEPLRRALGVARAHLDATLPFARAARSARIAALEARLTELHPPFADVFAQLWRFVEEEAALASEVGLAQQPVSIDGERRLVDVARVSMGLLYVRAGDGRVGWARPQPEGWRFEWIDEPTLTGAIREVFVALERNQTFGRHRLALPVVPAELAR